MDLRPYIDDITRQLAVAADAGGDEARVVAERLVAPLESAIRLALQDALAAAAEEITRELAPGSVELHLRGRDPEFVVTLPPADPGAGEQVDTADDADEWSNSSVNEESPAASVEDDEGGMLRINLRVPNQIKTRIERAAGAHGLSVNAWVVRAASAALDREPGPGRHLGRQQGRRRYAGWVR
jgi:predicted HicB family RNase H-like nuclease